MKVGDNTYAVEPYTEKSSPAEKSSAQQKTANNDLQDNLDDELAIFHTTQHQHSFFQILLQTEQPQTSRLTASQLLSEKLTVHINQTDWNNRYTFTIPEFNLKINLEKHDNIRIQVFAEDKLFDDLSENDNKLALTTKLKEVLDDTFDLDILNHSQDDNANQQHSDQSQQQSEGEQKPNEKLSIIASDAQ